MKQLPFEFRITLLYIIIGSLWILFSDEFAVFIAKDSHQFFIISTYKGWFYVLITGLLLFYLIKNEVKRRNVINQQLQKEIVVRREAEQNLILLNFAIKNVSESIFLVDENARLQFINEESCRILGYSRFELLSMSVPDINTDILMGQWPDHWNMLKMKHSLTFETSLKAKDGRIFPVEINANYIEYDNQNYIMALVRDITERKLAGDALRESESKYRMIVETASEGIWMLDSGQLTSFVNNRIVELTGHSIEELIGRPFSDIMFAEDIPDYYKRMEIRRQGISEKYESRVRHKRGNEIWFYISAAPVFDDEHRFCGTLIMLTDITERKRAEIALQRSNRELRAISKCNEVLMRSVNERKLLNDICQIICDEAGYRMAWVGYAENDEGRSIRPVGLAGVELGYFKDARISWADTEQGRGPSGTAIRSGKSICINDFETEPLAAPWRVTALKYGHRSSVALPLKDESGNTFGVLNIYSTVPSTFSLDEIRLMEELAGDLAFGIITLRTRAERKKAESQREEAIEAMRRAKEQAETANRYKTEFLTNISHEVRTPLNAILGFAYILKSVDMPQEYKKSVEFINEQGKHLLALVENILDVSRMEFGKTEIESAEFDLVKLLENVVVTTREKLVGKEVGIVLTAEGTIPSLKGDVLRVKQIVENLLNNAVNYTEYGEIKMTAKRVDIRPDEKKIRIRISVKDTGIGIPSEKLPHIFDPFSRFHEFYKGKSFKGTGMGLYIVKELVRLMGGEIHATSEVGKGSEFIVFFNFDKIESQQR